MTRLHTHVSDHESIRTIHLNLGSIICVLSYHMVVLHNVHGEWWTTNVIWRCFHTRINPALICKRFLFITHYAPQAIYSCDVFLKLIHVSIKSFIKLLELFNLNFVAVDSKASTVSACNHLAWSVDVQGRIFVCMSSWYSVFDERPFLQWNCIFGILIQLNIWHLLLSGLLCSNDLFGHLWIFILLLFH